MRVLADTTKRTAIRASAATQSRRATSASRPAWIITSAPGTVVGFALAGGGTNWGLASGFGNGRSDAMQAGVYGITHMGAAYVAGALAFTNHWFTTNRGVQGGQLSANFDGQSYGARLEGATVSRCCRHSG